MIRNQWLWFLVLNIIIFRTSTVSAYRVPNQSLSPPPPPPPHQPINRDYDDGPLPEYDPQREPPRPKSNSVYNPRERDRPVFNNYDDLNAPLEDNGGGPVAGPGHPGGPSPHHHHHHQHHHPDADLPYQSSYGPHSRLQPSLSPSERNKPSLDSKEPLRQDYATSNYPNDHRVPIPIPPPSPYPYAPVPVPMMHYPNPYEPRTYGQVGSYMPIAATYPNPYEMPAMNTAVQTAHSMTYPNAYSTGYPNSYPMSNMHQQQQFQNVLSSMMARNSFLGFVDPLILLAIIAVPVIAMLGFGSLIMPFIPVIIYVLNIFFPVGSSGRKRYRQHLIATKWLHKAQQHLPVHHPLNQSGKIDQWLSQLRNATNKFA